MENQNPYCLLKIVVIIPAYNEEQSIAKVIKDIPGELVSEIIVVNNNSTDKTVEEAEKAGATVLNENKQGYGASCLKGIEHAKSLKPDAIVFLDGDYSDDPREMELLLKPLALDKYDFVLGSRVLGKTESGSFPFHAKGGNVFAGFLMKIFWGVVYTDLGPFRAIKFDRLIQLNMVDHWYGWTVEMQIKAAKNKYRILEVPVSYRKRIGKSKVSGTLKGSFMAGTIILKTIFMEILDDVKKL